MLRRRVFEIVMVSRKQHPTAAWTYALSDVARTLLFVAAGAGARRPARRPAGAASRSRRSALAAMLRGCWREFGRELRLDLRAVAACSWPTRCPFALAVGIEVLQVNYHQYVVASRFDAGDVRHLRRRLPADSAGRSDHDVDRQRDDGRRWPRTRLAATAAPRSRCGTTRSRAWRSLIFPLAGVPGRAGPRRSSSLLFTEALSSRACRSSCCGR